MPYPLSPSGSCASDLTTKGEYCHKNTKELRAERSEPRSCYVSAMSVDLTSEIIPA